MPVARIVERQPHLLKQAKLDEQTEWAKYENMTLSPKAKANIHHKAHTGLRIYHYHTDHLGTPQELTNDRGEVVWLNYQMAWGGSFSQLNNVYNLDGLDVSADELQPFRFQGQFFDGETGLHYNRFRYYDSDVGMFISRDPIELMGGFNVFAYAPNPVMWIDPWGLANIKLRHYTSNQGFAGIKESMTIKGGDQNAVFATKAKGKPLSMADAADKFKIKQTHARNYIDFEIDEARVEHRVNDLGVEEYKIKGDVKLDEETTKFNKRTKC